MQKMLFPARAAFASLIFAALAALPVCAQSQATDAKQIGDWGVHCYPAASPSPCEMLEVATQNKTGKRVMSVSIAFVPQQNRYVFQVAVPLGVALNKGVKIVASGYGGPAMAYRRCDRGGCYVEGFMNGNALDALGAASAAGKIEIAAANGRQIDLPFSLRGFSEARKAMEDLAREKAAPLPAKP
jgi:invasion protein IalB